MQRNQPQTSSVSNSILLIGSGRLSHHLKHWNLLLTKPNQIFYWNRKQNLTELNDLLKKVDIVWLAISDSSLVSFYDKFLSDYSGITVHFSGAVTHAKMISAHPLMSFPKTLFSEMVYSNIHFVIDRPTTLENIFPGCKNSYSHIKPEQKAYYHSLCVLTGNFPQLLWKEALPALRDLQIPDSAFANYIHQVSDNFIQQKEHSVTGPFIRKDFQTIENNLAALTEQNTESSVKLKNIYSAFMKEFI